MSQNLVIIIAGPTASGKSQLAIDVALEVNGVVINADSMQVYKDTPIVSAAPSKEDLKKVSHRLFEIFPSNKNSNVVDWLELAVSEIKTAWGQGKVPVVVGGTGMYIDNLINGTTPIPPVSNKSNLSLKEMYDEMESFDNESWKRLSPNDSSRVIRAYNVFKETGISLSEWHKKPMLKRLENAKFFIIKIVPSVEEIDERCYLRFDKMMEMGALSEVTLLKEKKIDKSLPAMKALGVPELVDYLDGKTTLEEAIALGKLHTRQYAKRQRTWFKNKLKADVEITHCYKGNKEELAKCLSYCQI